MTTFSKYTFDVPEAKKVRVIINTDAKCEIELLIGRIAS